MVTFGQAFDFIVLLWIIMLVLITFGIAGIFRASRKLSIIIGKLKDIESDTVDINTRIEHPTEIVEEVLENLSKRGDPKNLK